MNAKELSASERQKLLELLKDRFDRNVNRHSDINWTQVLTKLKSNPGKLWSLNEMEKTGGEPDVIAYDDRTEEFVFFDCSTETPKGRRSVCYDRE